jgi:ABC-type sugar transport system ATPase subunit
VTGFPAIAVEGVAKRFGATQALDAVSFAVDEGEVHALVGENGAGKSTLIKILAGVHQQDTGRLLILGEPRELHGPDAAASAGVALVPQDVRVVPNLSVAENVMLGHLPVRRILGMVPVLDRHSLDEGAARALARLNFHPDVDGPAGSLPYAERQLVAIARALSRDARVLVLDEPTAALERREVNRLFDTVRALAAQGVAVIFISHRLDEVIEIADRCTVLRDGRVVGQVARGAFDADWLVRAMTGRDIEELHRPHAGSFGAPMLEASVGTSGDVQVRTREVLGLAGLLGSGTSTLLRRLFGAEGAAELQVRGVATTVAHPAAAISAGLGMVPGERTSGLVMDLSIRDNIALPSLGRRISDEMIAELMEQLDIRPRDPDRRVRELSGGNQQKVIFAKWLAARAEILLLDEPTQGVDIGAKRQIHRLMRDFAERGGAILFASSEAHEVMALSDKVAALRQGQIVAQMERGGDYTERTLRQALGG